MRNLSERFQEQAERNEFVIAHSTTTAARDNAEGQLSVYETWAILITTVDDPASTLSEHILNVTRMIDSHPAYYSGKLAALNAIKFLLEKE